MPTLPQFAGFGRDQSASARPCGSDPPKTMRGATWMLTRRWKQRPGRR